MRIEAILFDCDGVLVSTVDLHRTAFRAALLDVHASLAGAATDGQLNGLSTREKIRLLMRYGLTRDEGDELWRRKQELTVSMIWRAISRDDDKIAMLRMLRAQGRTLACVSNSIRQTTDMMLRAAGLAEHLHLVVSNEDVPRQKPAPDPYLLAMMKVGQPAMQCLAVEDAPHGVHSARAAGLNVWEVPGVEAVDCETMGEAIMNFERNFP